MELDKRIKEGKKPLDCFDIDKAEQFIGKKGYVTDFLQDFCNLNKVKTSELKTVSHTELFCYFCGSIGKKYFLPVEWVKEPEKTYRPYTIKDFEKAFLNDEFEDFIIFRDKNHPEDVYTMRYNGNFRKGEFEYICLGAKNFSFKSLFENYEVANYDGDFVPFGVLEE